MVPFRVKVLLTFICAFIFHGLLNAAAVGFQCREGERVKRNGKEKHCEPCGAGRYQPEPNSIQSCPPCTACNKKSGSEMTFQCTRTKNTICQCRKGFVSSEDNSATCKCDIGFGLNTKTKDLPECRKCEDGFFTTQIDTACVKWKQCEKSGVKVPGTNTVDAICNDESDREGLPRMSSMSSTPTMPAPTSIQTQTQRLVSLKPALTTKPEGTNLQSDYGKGIVVFIFGLVLLLILPLVTIKLVIKPCIKNEKQVPNGAAQDSICRRPVEESGESSRSSLVKSSSGE